VGIQVAPSSYSAPPLMVTTVRDTHRLSAGTEYRIGRNPGADFELADARVSWDHAVLYADGPTWVLEDRSSRNGTYLGSERISRLEITGPRVVHFGNAQDGQVLRFELQQFEQPARPPAQSPGWGAGQDSVFLPGVDREPTSRIRLQARVVTIGRRPDNNVVVPDLGVSKQHAELRMTPTGRYQIIDLGSHNGTYVNGTRVNEAELSEDDIVSIGRSTFRLADGVLIEYVDDGKIEFEAHELLVRVNDGGKQKVLLEGITFTLPERSMMAVIGPAGAGKSTLLNALTGKRQADEGRVLYDYRDLYESYDELKHRIGLVPQQSVTHDQLTARAALGYAAELRFPSDAGEAERSQRVDEVLGELDMTPHAGTRIDRLSGGQQKRVNIGLELLTRPSLLFLDEPTSPLDPHLKRELFLAMRKMADKAAEQGQSVVVITHDVESKLIDQCDRLIVLVPGGRMAYFGSPREGLAYFGKEDWADVFAEFADNPGRDWASEYRSSAACAKYVTTPMAARLNQPLPQRRPDDETGRHRRGRMTQIFTMARRYRRVMAADRGYLMFTGLLPIILGGLVRIMQSSQGLGGGPGTNPGAETVLLILVMAACLSGTANSIREFIKEREIFERERMAGLSAGAYLGSKVLVLGVISVIQAILIVVIGLAGTKMGSGGSVIPGSPLIEMAIGVAALCVVSMLLGLVISVLVTKGDQTMPALVVIIMVQVVLSGGVLALNHVESLVSYIAPARWGLGALASTINLNVLAANPAIKPDAMWAHSARQWGLDMGVLVAMGVIFLIIAGVRLNRMGPHRRK
jgi:ABC-type multidrug transport system ATPase subunit/pSer/pThr/pTyr-binding forkhead associated (FHA) protein